MKTMHPTFLLAAALLACGARAQSTTTEPGAATPTPTPPTSPTPSLLPATSGEWSFGGSVYTYFVPDDGNYAQPTVTADRGMLHLEARYNYEDRDTGSVWIGGNFHFGDELTWDITPMIGGVFGDTAGIAPGYHSTISWWKLEFYSEAEYVFDTRESSDSFFYTWSELTVSPVESLRVGLVIQRTKVYETDLDVQRGLLLGYSSEKLDFSASYFNPDESEPVFVLSVGLGL